MPGLSPDDLPNLPIPPILQELDIPPGVDPMEFIASLPDDKFMQLMSQVDDIVKNLDDSERKKLDNLSQKLMPEQPPLAMPSLPELPPISEPSKPQLPPQPVIERSGLFTATNAEKLVQTIITHTSSLIGKIKQEKSTMGALVAQQPHLSALVAKLKAIQNPLASTWLTEKQAEQLMQKLNELSQTLEQFEPHYHAIPTVNECEESPYDVLMLDPTASQAAIKERYQEFQHLYDPITIEEKMSRTGATKAHIARAQKEAHFLLTHIKDAYEQLTTPHLRQQLDNEQCVTIQMQQAMRAQRRQAEQALAGAFQKTFAHHHILDDLDAFIKQHEPAMEAEKKRREKAIPERLKEQEALSALQPRPSPGGPYERERITPRQPSRNSGYDAEYGSARAGRNYGAPQEQLQSVAPLSDSSTPSANLLGSPPASRGPGTKPSSEKEAETENKPRKEKQAKTTPSRTPSKKNPKKPTAKQPTAPTHLLTLTHEVEGALYRLNNAVPLTANTELQQIRRGALPQWVQPAIELLDTATVKMGLLEKEIRTSKPADLEQTRSLFTSRILSDKIYKGLRERLHHLHKQLTVRTQRLERLSRGRANAPDKLQLLQASLQRLLTKFESLTIVLKAPPKPLPGAPEQKTGTSSKPTPIMPARTIAQTLDAAFSDTPSGEPATPGVPEPTNAN